MGRFTLHLFGSDGKRELHWSAPIVKTMASNEIDWLLKYSLPSQKKRGVVCLLGIIYHRYSISV